MATKRRKKTGKSKRARKHKAAPRRIRRRRSSSSKGPRLIVSRGMAVAKRGHIWAGRLGTQALGHVLARNKTAALRQFRAHAGKLLRGGS